MGGCSDSSASTSPPCARTRRPAESPARAGGPPSSRAEQVHRKGGQLTLMHDLKSCLRIIDGTITAIDVQTNPGRWSPAQNLQIRAAVPAVTRQRAAGKDHRAHLRGIDLEYKTHLDALRIGAERAARDGLFTARLPDDRALLATDITTGTPRAAGKSQAEVRSPAHRTCR